MKKQFYILQIVFLPLLPFAQNISSQQMEVMMKMTSLRSALLNKDSIGLSNLLSDDVTYGHTNGLIQTKSQLIRAVMSSEQDYKTIDPSDIKVRVFDNTGIVNMKANVSMIFQKNPLIMSMNIILVWIKKDKDWKLVARQSVKIVK